MKVIIKNIAAEYRDEGKGPAVLFLHGWKDNLRSFDPLLPHLSEKWRIIRVDLPGFGLSESPQKPWNIDNYVQFVKDLIDKLNVKVDILIGHSFGGRIAIKAVALKAIKPRKLVLIASAGIAKTNTIRNRLFYIIAKVGKLITFLPPLFFWRRQLRKKLYDAAGSDYLESGELKETFLNVIKDDLSGHAAEITIPTLLIWGDKDTETPLGDGERLLRTILGSRLEIITGAGHFVHRENPRQVAKLINQFAL